MVAGFSFRQIFGFGKPEGMKNALCCFAVWILLSPALAARDSVPMNDTETPALRAILERYREHRFRTQTVDAEKVKDHLATLDAAGRWPDVDYEDDKRGNWDLLMPANRLRDFALALSLPDAADGLADSDLEDAIERVLDDWLAHRYEASNWWFNQIGIPRLMRDAAVLLEGRLDSERWAGLLEIVNQHHVRGTGANLLWSAELALHYGCLVGDAGIVADAARRIRREIVVGQREGIQDDWSFFQHAERLQTFHYGQSYLHVALPLGWQLRGTPWEYSKEEVRILSEFLLEGVQWMLRGEFTVPSTMDRMASRPGTLRVRMRPYVTLWSEVDSERRAELETFAARLAGEHEPLDGFRHFARADFTVYHRPGFSFFVKTVSDRTLLTESINQENLLGGDFHTGDHYLVRDGMEYLNLMPVWDWKRLPGIASAKGMERIERRPFTGGLGDGTSGFATMDLAREGDGGTLGVRRSWFFHGDAVISLAGGWETSGEISDPFLVLDQSRLRGDVSVVDSEGRTRPLDEGGHLFESPVAVVHGDIAWFPLGRAPVSVQLVTARGSWHRINVNRSAEPLEERVFLASIEIPGKAPEGGGFAVMPGVEPAEAVRIARRPPWTIVRNDRAIQAIEFEADELGMAVFFEAGAVELGGRELSVSRPCLVFRRGEDLLAVDPTASGGTVEIRWGELSRSVDLPPDGRSAAW